MLLRGEDTPEADAAAILLAEVVLRLRALLAGLQER